MIDTNPNDWTLEVLLDTNWESVSYPSRDAATDTLESVIGDYGDRVAMAHFIGPESRLEIANLYGMRSRRAALAQLGSRTLNPRPSA